MNHTIGVVRLFRVAHVPSNLNADMVWNIQILFSELFCDIMLSPASLQQAVISFFVIKS